MFGALPWYVFWPLLVLAYCMLRLKREYLSGADSVFVSGDPHNVLVVHAVFTTKTRLSLSLAKKLVGEKIACHTRFRQLIVKRYWKWHFLRLNEDAFSVEKHIKVHTLECASPSDPVALQTALEAYTSQLIQTPIDLSRPPWEFILIPEYGARGSAFVFRAHHSIADGVTLMRLAMSVFEKAEQPHTADEDEATQANTTDSNTKKNTAAPASTSSKAATSSSSFRALQKYRKPKPVLPSNLFARLSAVLSAVWKVLTLRKDPTGMFKAPTNITPDIPVSARWLRTPLDLGELKQLAYASGTSVNDVAFYLVTSALRAYALRRMAKKNKAESPPVLQTIMWVSAQGTHLTKKQHVHPHPPVGGGTGAGTGGSGAGGDFSFGNQIGAVTLALPLDVAEDLERLAAVRRLTSLAQTTPEPLVTRVTLQLLGLIPTRLIWWVWRWMAYNASSSMSNVPGPSTPVTWGKGGPEIERMVFFVPPQGTVSSFITILSYAHAVQIGFLSDSRAVTNPREVLDLCAEELDKLKATLDQLQKSGKIQEALELRDEQKEKL